MPITWCILGNNNFETKPFEVDEINFNDLVNYISSLTCMPIRELELIRNGRVLKLGDVLKSGDYFYVINAVEQARLTLLQSVAKQKDTIIPDAKPYELGAANIGVYLNREHKFEQTLFKIMKRVEHLVLIKLLHPRQINWGRGPTFPSIYAWLDTSKKLISPVYINSIDTELLDAFPEYNNNCQFKYESLEISTCCVCLENTANTSTHCKTPHVVVCNNCVTKLKQCPICKNNILGFATVEYF